MCNLNTDSDIQCVFLVPPVLMLFQNLGNFGVNDFLKFTNNDCVHGVCLCLVLTAVFVYLDG